MNAIDSVEAFAAATFAFEWHEKIIAIVISYALIRKLVSVGSQEEQYKEKLNPLKLYLGDIWGTLALIVLLYDVLTKILDDNLMGWLRGLLQAVGDFLSPILNDPIVQIFGNFLFPIPSTMIMPIKKYLRFFIMLFLLFFLEALVHKEIRRSVWQWLVARFKRKRVVMGELEKTDKQDKEPIKKMRPQASKKLGKPQKRPLLHYELYDYDHELSRCFLKEECKWQRLFFQIALLAVLFCHFFLNTSVGMTMFPLYAMTEFWMMTMVPTRREILEKSQEQDGTEERKDHLKKVIDEITTGDVFATCRGRTPTVFILNNDTTCKSPIFVEEVHKTHEDKLLDQYFALCKKLGIRFDPMLAFPAKEILRGRSVVFSTRFYQDMDYSFYLPMLHILQSGYHCLVVTGEPIDMRPMREWLLSGRKRIIGDTTIWKLERLGLRGRQNDTDIGYITAEDLGNAKVMQGNSAFFSKVKLVLIINASSLLHKQLFGIMRLRKVLHQNCTFAICNDNAVGLTDIYSHLLQTELNLVVPTTAKARRSYFMFFDEENFPDGNLSDCWQFILGRVFLQADADAFKKVYWYSNRTTPVKDIAGLHSGMRSADEYDSPADQAGKLVVGVDDTNCPRENFSCVIVEDEIYNPAELGMQFASRGREEVVVAVFSPNYFLRDYIRYHFIKFNAEFKKIVQTFPAYCMSERNAILQIMWNMERVHLDEDDIHSICVLLGQRELENALWPQGYIDQQVLIERFVQYTNISNIEYYLHYEHKFDHERVLLEFWMDPIPYSEYDRKRPCYYICTAFGADRRILPQCSKVQLMQSYLPGQTVSLTGQSYEVIGIVENDSAVEMFVRRSAQCLYLRREYHQRREIRIHAITENSSGQSYSFKDAEQESEFQLVLRRYTADKIEVATLGYWTIFADDSENIFTPLETDVRQQTYHPFYAKDFLCVELNGADSTGDEYLITQGLAFALNELFRTVYAEYRYQLLICDRTSSEGEMLVLENRLWGTIHRNRADHNRFYVIEDSEEDIGLLDSVMLHFERLLHMISEVDDYYRSHDGGTENAGSEKG